MIVAAPRVPRITVPLPEPRHVRFNPEALYTAVDKRRRKLRLSHRAVCRQIGECGPGAIHRLGQGKYPSMDLFMRIMFWLGETDITPYMERTGL